MTERVAKNFVDTNIYSSIICHIIKNIILIFVHKIRKLFKVVKYTIE